MAATMPRYKWLWVVAFVCPQSGETSWWLVPALNAPTFNRLLHAFTAEHGAGSATQILLVLDGAGWHTGHAVTAPKAWN